jgi:hypothetical protein
MTGRQAFDLSRLQRLELRRFLDLGGLLLVETAAADLDAVQRQMAALLPEGELKFAESLPNDSPRDTADPVRVARLHGRPAILLTVLPTQSDLLLRAALAARSR